MTDAKLEAVVAVIPLLTAAQRARLSAALLAAGTGARKDSRATEAVHAALKAELGASGATVWGLRKYQGHKRFTAVAETIVAYVKKELRPANHGEERKLLRYLVRLVMKDLVKRGKPSDQNNVLWNLDRACPLLDRAFPGYREAGWFPQLAKRIKL